MADTVKVDGVTLTRAQVERAMKELNAPTFEPGDILVFKNGNSDRFLVGDKDIDTAFAAAWKSLCRDVAAERMVNTIRLRDGMPCTASIDKFRKVGDGSSL